MLTRVANMFRVTDLRNKILFTLFMLGLYRLGSNVPVPGVDFDALQQLQAEAEAGGVLGFLRLFSGGALTQMAIFALGIMPYITSSIIMQILSVVIPKLEEWREQGAIGQRKITQWTRYITVAIGLVQSTALAFLFGTGRGSSFFGGASGAEGLVLIPDFTPGNVMLVVLTMTAGTGLLMWIGELITQRGIGNGMSLLIFASVVATLPGDSSALKAQLGWSGAFFFGLLAIAMLVGIVFIEQGQRRIPVQFAKRVVGRRMYGGNSTYIPLKVNQSGVIPIIFASSVLYLPVLASNMINVDWFQRFINDNLLVADNPVYLATYGLLIVGFAYFYTAITFDPAQQADQIRKQGGFIPGIRPGPKTEEYLSKILSRITLPGAIFIALIALLPSFLLAMNDVQQFSFGGVAILIAAGVALETMKQIDSQLMMRNYEGFLK